jgi:hypothetical protein
MKVQKNTIPQMVLTLKAGKGTINIMATLLQRGFVQPISGAISIADLLTALPGFSSDYVRDRVQTIFVNGLAEDNIHRQLVAGDTLALSAAMPGLAGAIFRRGGQHAFLRTRPVASAKGQGDQSGQITLKLFNMIATETGSQLLETGLLVRGAVLARFFDRQAERMLPLIIRAELEGVCVKPEQLAAVTGKYGLLFVQIQSQLKTV